MITAYVINASLLYPPLSNTVLNSLRKEITWTSLSLLWSVRRTGPWGTVSLPCAVTLGCLVVLKCGLPPGGGGTALVWSNTLAAVVVVGRRVEEERVVEERVEEKWVEGEVAVQSSTAKKKLRTFFT